MDDKLYTIVLQLVSQVARLEQWQKDFETRQTIALSAWGIILTALEIALHFYK